MHFIFRYLTAAFCAVLALSFAVNAQKATRLNSIEVLVNDQPISTLDINERLRLVIAVSGGVSSEEELLQVREQVIRAMVDELLQIQEAAESELVIPQEQLESYFARRAQGLGQSPDELEQNLAAIGSSKRSMQSQLNAEIAWGQLVQGRFGPYASVSDDEVNGFIQNLYDNKGKFEFRLSEIILLVDDPTREDQIRRDAETLVQRIRDGANFNQIARQLSASSSAAVGGDLGWIQAENISADRLAVVQSLPVGEVSDPIRTSGGFLILASVDRRRIMVADPLDTQLALKQLFLSRDKAEADPALLNTFTEAVTSLQTEGLSCDAVEAFAASVKAAENVDIGRMRVRELQVSMRQTTAALNPGDVSKIFELEDGYRALVLCDKQEPQVAEPDFDAVYGQLEQQRLALIARRYLRDIRRDAIIDYR